MNQSLVQAVLERLDRVERDYRRLKWVVASVLAIGAAVALMRRGAYLDLGVIQAQSGVPRLGSRTLRAQAGCGLSGVVPRIVPKGRGISRLPLGYLGPNR